MLIYKSWYSFWEGVIVCGLVRVCFQQHVTWSINSVCHIWGRTDFKTEDNSKNNWILAFLAFGEVGIMVIMLFQALLNMD